MRAWIYIATVAVLAGCQKENFQTQTLFITDFHTLELNSTFDIKIQEDTVSYLEISGDDRFVKGVSATVEDSVLSLENVAKKRWTHPEKNRVTIIVHSSTLRLVKVKESCDVQSIGEIVETEFGMILTSKSQNIDLQLNCGTFYYWNEIQAGGLLKLNGSVNILKIWNFGILSVDTEALQANYAEVEQNGKNDCTTRASTNINYTISNAGNIICYGNPTADGSTTGKGELILK